MKKTIPVWFLALAVASAIALTFLVTFLVTYDALSQPKLPDSTTADTEAPDSTMFDVGRVEDVLERFQSSWVNSLDEDLTDFIIESILLGTGDVYSNYRMPRNMPIITIPTTAIMSALV